MPAPARRQGDAAPPGLPRPDRPAPDPRGAARAFLADPSRRRLREGRRSPARQPAATASAGAGTGWTSGATATGTAIGTEVRDSQPHIWRWRDWIVESLNADKGYDRMIVEMLAADEVAPDDPEALRATGFLVRNWYKFNRNVWLDNTVEHTAKAFLGLTFNCARCHDHKYDPIAQEEYYRFRAFFEPHEVRTDRVPGQPDAAQGRPGPRLRRGRRRADLPLRPRRREAAREGQAARCPASRRSSAKAQLPIEPVALPSQAVPIPACAASSRKRRWPRPRPRSPRNGSPWPRRIGLVDATALETIARDPKSRMRRPARRRRPRPGGAVADPGSRQARGRRSADRRRSREARHPAGRRRRRQLALDAGRAERTAAVAKASLGLQRGRRHSTPPIKPRRSPTLRPGKTPKEAGTIAQVG